jgi:hypothetical protein
MNELNEKGQQHGLWEYDNETYGICHIINWFNGEKHGIHECYSNGLLEWGQCFKFGKIIGYAFNSVRKTKRFYI